MELMGNEGSSGLLSGDLIPSEVSSFDGLVSLRDTLSKDDRMESTIERRKLRFRGLSSDGVSGPEVELPS